MRNAREQRNVGAVVAIKGEWITDNRQTLIKDLMRGAKVERFDEDCVSVVGKNRKNDIEP